MLKLLVGAITSFGYKVAVEWGHLGQEAGDGFSSLLEPGVLCDLEHTAEPLQAWDFSFL